MKIAIVAPIEESIPPKKYGGIEWIVYDLTHGMASKGHQVDLFATGDSDKEKSYNLIPIVPSSLRTDPIYETNPVLMETTKLQTLAKTAELIRHGEYDIVHNHAGWRFLLFSRFIDKHVLTTHHGPLSPDFQKMIFSAYNDFPYVSISNNQRKDAPNLNYIATIYNGIDVKLFPYFENTNVDEHDYMLFFARMDPEKGAIEAAQTAKNCQKKLVVAAKVDPIDEPYFSKFKPMIDNDLIKFVGEIGHEERIELYQKARCLIAPIKWEEPFGLMFTESMSCGTPVVTFSRGSAPEVIVDGKTGFLVNPSDQDVRGDWIIKKTGVAGFQEAVGRMFSMPKDQYLQMRKNSREHVEKNFTVGKMVDEYEKVYEKILSGNTG